MILQYVIRSTTNTEELLRATQLILQRNSMIDSEAGITYGPPILEALALLKRAIETQTSLRLVLGEHVEAQAEASQT